MNQYDPMFSDEYDEPTRHTSAGTGQRCEFLISPF